MVPSSWLTLGQDPAPCPGKGDQRGLCVRGPAPVTRWPRRTCPGEEPRAGHEVCLVPCSAGLGGGGGVVLNSGGFSALGCSAMTPVRVNHILW